MCTYMTYNQSQRVLIKLRETASSENCKLTPYKHVVWRVVPAIRDMTVPRGSAVETNGVETMVAVCG